MLQLLIAVATLCNTPNFAVLQGAKQKTALCVNYYMKCLEHKSKYVFPGSWGFEVTKARALMECIEADTKGESYGRN